MASFDLTANINARLSTSNVQQIANQLRQQLSVTANINIQLARGTTAGVRTFTRNLDTLNRQLVQFSINSNNATTSLNALAAAFQNINRQNAQYQRNLQNINNQTTHATAQMEQFGRQAGLAFRRFAGFTIASGIVRGLAGAVVSATREAIDFQHELVKIAQVGGTSIAALKPLGDEITRLAVNLGVSSKDLTNVSQILVQAGLSAGETKQALEALAKSALAPTFTNIEETAEGAIAIFKQFGIQAKDLEKALGSINTVSAQFAVESDDVIAAVKRTGGVFAATSSGVSEGLDALNEFIAVFTSVRATTRESAETIATGLRTIFTRLQRPQTIQFLQELGINLTDLEGKFVGPYEAVQRLSTILNKVDARDPAFAKIVEELGGFRQVGKVIPLLSQQETRIKALQAAQQGQNSLTADAEKAQQSYAVQIAKVAEQFRALLRDISQTDTFRLMLEQILDLTSGFIRLADSLKGVIPLITGLALVRGTTAAVQFGRGLFGRGGIRFHSGGLVRKPYASGGDVNIKGLVPGGKGIKDDVPATLQEGEFVVRRRAVDAIGKSNLDKMNQTGRLGFAQGGLINQSGIGAAIFKPFNEIDTTSTTITEKELPGLKETTGKKSLSYTITRQALNASIEKQISKVLFASLKGGVEQSSSILTGGSFKLPSVTAKNILETVNPAGVIGSMFEGILLSVDNATTRSFDSGTLNPNRPFDFANGFSSPLASQFPLLRPYKYIDAKVSARSARSSELKPKIIQQLKLESPELFNDRTPKKLNKTKALEIQNKYKQAKNVNTKLKLGKLGPGFASGGSVKGDVPVLLTSGEYVLNKKSAKSLGSTNLNMLNNADRIGFAKGGMVRKKYFAGGQVLRILADLISRAGSGVSRYAGNVSRDLGTSQIFSRGIARSPHRANLAFQNSRVGQAVRNVGGLSTVSLLAGGQIGGTAGGALSGAGLGASIGSVVPGIGTGVGAAVGAIYGAFTAFTQAKLDDKIAKSTKDMESYINKLDDAISNFGKDHNVINLLKAIGTRQASDKRDRIQREIGIDSGSSDLSTDSSAIGSIFKNISLNRTGRFIRDTGSSTLEGAAKGAVVGGVGGAVVGGAPGAVAGTTLGYAAGGAGAFTNSILRSPEDFVTAAEVREQVRQDFNISTQAGQDTKARNQTLITASTLSAEELFKRGLSVEQVSERLGQTGIKGIGLGAANIDQLAAIGSARDIKTTSLDTGKERIVKADDQIFAILSSAAKEQLVVLYKRIKAEQKVQQALENSNIALDQFYNKVDQASVEVERSANAGSGFARRNQDILSGGFSGVVRENPFANPKAFSQEEIRDASFRITRDLGGDSTGFSGEVLNAAQSVKDLQVRLPQVINDVVNKSGDKDLATQKTRLTEAIGTQFPLLPKSVSDKLVREINSFTADSRQGTTLKDFAKNQASEVGNSVLKPANELFKKTVEIQNQVNKEYAEAVGNWIKLQQDANRMFEDVNQRRIQNENDYIQVTQKRSLTFDELTKGFQSEVKSGAITGGAKGTDVGSLVTRFNELSDRRKYLEGIQGQVESGLISTPGVDKRLTNEFGVVDAQKSDIERTLKLIATSTSITASATTKLQEIENKKQAAQGALETYATADPQQRFEIDRQIQLAGVAQRGGNLQGEDLAAAIAGQRTLGAVSGREDSQVNEDIRQQLIRNTDAGRLATKAGVNINDVLGVSQEEQNFRDIFRKGNRQQQAAGNFLAGQGQDKANEFQGNLDKRYQAIADSLSLVLKEFENTLNAVPKSIAIGGEVSVSVNVNGAETLQGLNPFIEKLVQEKIEVALQANLDPSSRIENIGNRRV